MTLRWHQTDVFISLGSNIENRQDHLNRAIEAVGKQKNIRIVDASSVYETESWGVTEQKPFLNQVVRLSVQMNPYCLLEIFHQIESILGRERHEKWEARPIDLDILSYGQSRIQDDALVLPHQHLESRRFVLKPMNEIAANYYIPKFRKTVSELLEICKDACWVRLNPIQ